MRLKMINVSKKSFNFICKVIGNTITSYQANSIRGRDWARKYFHIPEEVGWIELVMADGFGSSCWLFGII